jgi:hypothetical protein
MPHASGHSLYSIEVTSVPQCPVSVFAGTEVATERAVPLKGRPSKRTSV